MIELKVVRPDLSCLPCAAGDHEGCRHNPDKERGTEYLSDERRWVKYEGDGRYGNRKEIPRDPCLCETGGHVGDPGTCNATVLDEFGSYRCSKPTKGMMPQTKFSYGREAPQVEVCGIHLSGYNRRIKNDQIRQEKWEADRERSKAVEGAKKASNDWAQRLRDEFSLPVEGLSAGVEIRCSISPEQAYSILDKVRSMLDEVYEDHPFKNGDSAL